MFRLYRHRLLVGALLAALLFLIIAATVSAHESHPAEDKTGVDVEPLTAAAEQVASATGLSVEEAHAALLRQPRTGRFQVALEEEGPPSFGGMLIEYEPRYQIVLLASENRGELVRQAARDLPFDDLNPYVVVRETAFTEDVLERERDRLRQLGAGLLTTTDVDLATGEILLTVATSDDEQTLRARVKQAQPPIQARDVIIWQGVSQDQHSLGGRDTRINGASQCTTGFSVKRLSDGVEGVATAAHCANGNRYITHHSGVTLDRVEGQDSGSLDVEWHKTPGLDDIKKFRWHQNGGERDVSGRVSRSDMTIGHIVCVFGAKTREYQCGEIKGKSYEPGVGSGGPHNDTFIKVASNVDTQVGDSGAPWFLGENAYGIHTGTVPCGEPGVPCYPYFMAQNFMGQLGIQVQITGE